MVLAIDSLWVGLWIRYGFGYRFAMGWLVDSLWVGYGQSKGAPLDEPLKKGFAPRTNDKILLSEVAVAS